RRRSPPPGWRTPTRRAWCRWNRAAPRPPRCASRCTTTRDRSRAWTRPGRSLSRRSPMRFDGAVALVSGAGSGIGAATAALLAERGAAVGVADIDPDAAAAVAASIGDAGGTAVAVACDVRDDGAVGSAVRTVVERLGGLDILVQCAGIVRY